MLQLPSSIILNESSVGLFSSFDDTSTQETEFWLTFGFCLCSTNLTRWVLSVQEKPDQMSFVCGGKTWSDEVTIGWNLTNCFIILGFTPSSDVLLRKEELNCLTGAGDQKGGGPHGGDQLGDQDGGDQEGGDQEGGDQVGGYMEPFIMSEPFLSSRSGPFFTSWTLFTLLDYYEWTLFTLLDYYAPAPRCRLITDTIDPPLDCRLKREKVPALIWFPALFYRDASLIVRYN